MKYLYFIITLLVTLMIPAKLNSQNDLQVFDSLLKAVIKNPDDAEILENFSDVAKNILYDIPDSSYFYISELYRLADNMNHRYLMATALNLQGMILEQSDYRRSIEKYNQSLEISEKSGYNKLTASTLNNLSIVYSLMGEYNQSVEYLLRLLKLTEAMNDTMRLAVALNNIGLRYFNMDRPEIALDYYRRAKNLNTITNDVDRLATNLSNIGVAFQAMQKFDSALIYQNNAIALHKKNNDSFKLQYGYQAMVYLYLEMKEFDKAWEIYDSAMYHAKIVDDTYGMINLIVAKATLLNEESNYRKSVKILTEAEKLALEMNYKSILVDIYEQLTVSFRGLKNYIKAFEYNEKYIALQDSLQNLEKNKAIQQVNLYEKQKAETEREILSRNIEIQNLNLKRQKLLRNFIIIIGALFLVMLIGLWSRFRFVRKTKRELEVKNTIIENERERSDTLLLNILPAQTAKELKASGKSKAKMYEMVTVLFTDFKGFTNLAELMTPQELVDEIDHCYQAFDDIIGKHQVEKIKTIGDAYMCAGGLPKANTTNALDVLKAACEIREFMERYKKERMLHGKPFFEARMGIHTGPVVAGIVGNRKFAYDIWGDTVNIASRMESGGEVGMINISQTTFEKVKEHFICTYRGKLETKNKGLLDMYFVEKAVDTIDKTS